MRKGFTLVELLAVIIILGILMAIVVPIVTGDIDKAKQTSYQHLMNTIENTAEIYARENKDLIPELGSVGGVLTITIQDLIDDQGLGTPVIDPRDNRQISPATTITITTELRNEYTVQIGTLVYLE